jgi:hypothetical protein
MNIFGASFQVVALVIAAVCIVSAILGRQYGIGPVQIPAPRDLLPRAALAILGLVMLAGAFWSSLFGAKTPLDIMTAMLPKPPSPEDAAFVGRNDAFRKVLEAHNVPLNTVRVESEAIYGEFPAPQERCQVVFELVDYAPDRVDVFPQAVLRDAIKYRAGSADTRALGSCDEQLKVIAHLIDHVATTVAAAEPHSDARDADAGTAGAVSRPTPVVNTGGSISQETATRVLTAVTLPKDQGWIYIGFRDRDRALLIADRRISVAQIPRAGTVATTADSQLLDTLDPGKSLGTVKGYVRAGSDVQIYNISGPRHYAAGVWDGYDVYALVRVVSTPQRTVIGAPQALEGATSTASPVSSIEPVADDSSTAPTLAFAAAPPDTGSTKCPGLPGPAANLFVQCNETYPVRFGEYRLQAYKVTDSHSTGIHFRNIGPLPVSLSIYPNCSSVDTCPIVKNAELANVSDPHDGGNDYIYNVPTLAPFDFGWTVAPK